jgi:cell wall-associated NlpC family hydrolase
LVAAGVTPGFATDAATVPVDSAVEDTVIGLGAVSLASVSEQAAWSLDVPQITINRPLPKSSKVAQVVQATVLSDTVADVAKASPKAQTAFSAQPSLAAAVKSTVKAAEPVKPDAADADEVSHVSGSAVLEVAERYIGVPYVHGGNTPRGFDCSGFTQYVFGQLGIKLPHYSEAQPRKGRVVSRSEARPGDLVYTPGHVGIYAGGNKMIDSARTGTTIRYRQMWQRNPTFIRLVD